MKPTVCAIMLTHDRPAMAMRAVESFRAQTYDNKHLLIYDNGKEQGWLDTEHSNEKHWRCFWNAHRGLITIGSLRNEAVWQGIIKWNPDVFVAWDSDDYSHPKRIAEQVALLESTGADIVGYSDLLFWDERRYVAARERHEREPIGGQNGRSVEGRVNEAWLYCCPTLGYATGTTQAFWRRTWESRPYQNTSDKEDYHFGVGRKVATVSSLVGSEPRMIASIHGSNTMQAHYDELLIPGKSDSWHAAPEWAGYCRRTMSLHNVGKVTV